MATLSEKVTGVLGEVARAAEFLKGEMSPEERIAVARTAHRALDDSLEVMERHQAAQKWAGRKIREMKLSEKSRMVADIGHEEFRRRLEAEY